MRSYTLTSGSQEAKGRRDTMEDTHIHLDEVTDHGSPHFERVAYYGVYDGHGGKTTADLVREMLHGGIFQTEEFSQGKVPESLSAGFQAVDAIVVEKANTEGWMNGTTAVVGLVLDSILYMANCGDAEACAVSINSDGVLEVEELTYPHKASDSSEKKRIEELGGHVFFGRVFGALAVARAFGDSRYKKPKTSQNFVTVEPYLKQVQLTPNHKYLIFACDGLWDVCSHQQAAEFAHAAFLKDMTPAQVSEALVQHALDLRTDDNVTVVVVSIDWQEEGEPKNESGGEQVPGSGEQEPEQRQTV